MSTSSKTRTSTNSPSGHSGRPSGTRTPSQGRVSSGTSFQSESPTKSEPKKIPPIKAPVGLARGPDLKNVRSKIGSLDNVKHRPSGGERKVETQKLEWNVKSRVGSLENANHKPMGGDVRVRTQKLEWKVASKVGSLDNVKHQPGGGTVKIFDEKYAKGAKTPSPATTPTPGSKSGSFSNGKPSFDGHNISSIESPTPAPANRTANSRKPANSTGTSAGTRTSSTSESNSATNEITAKMNSVNLTALRT